MFIIHDIKRLIIVMELSLGYHVMNNIPLIQLSCIMIYIMDILFEQSFVWIYGVNHEHKPASALLSLFCLSSASPLIASLYF